MLNNYCLFINGTKLVKISGLFRFTCIVCGIQCSELNYILLAEHLMCLYEYEDKVAGFMGKVYKGTPIRWKKCDELDLFA